MLEMDSAIDEIKKNLFKELKEVNRGGGGNAINHSQSDEVANCKTSSSVGAHKRISQVQ